MKVWIMRGLPGSGKTSFIESKKRFLPGGTPIVVCSADHYHVKDGVYQYDPTKAKVAHDQCFCKYLDAVSPYDKSLPENTQVFVDNTNTTLWEIAPYVRLAEVYGIPFEIVYTYTDLDTAIKRNIHRVPVNTICAMHRSLQNELSPSHWPITFLGDDFIVNV